VKKPKGKGVWGAIAGSKNKSVMRNAGKKKKRLRAGPTGAGLRKEARCEKSRGQGGGSRRRKGEGKRVRRYEKQKVPVKKKGGENEFWGGGVKDHAAVEDTEEI